MKHVCLILFMLSSYDILAQHNFKGTIIDAKNNLPIEGVTISIMPGNNSSFSDERGQFRLHHNYTNAATIHFSCIGFESVILSIDSFKRNNLIILSQQETQLRDIIINARAGQEYKTISKLDIKVRGVNNSQEILRMVPGLFIGQHQGGGKAEQIFVRGFDCDHGTDINITADGIPVNLVSQAHGQGYADMHFIIPETIENVDFQKGPYNASKGNFTTSGFVDLKTKNILANNTLKIEGGMFDTYRLMGMFNLLSEKSLAKKQSLYVATELGYSNGFFQFPQDFRRYNLFGKFITPISKNTQLSFSASLFKSKWNASGQIPDRAVNNGTIDFFGAIDNTEGGKTDRENFNLQFISSLPNGSILKNQLYFTKYHFDLHTNFTFYLEDTINGDQIRQKEGRNLFGYNGSYRHLGEIGNLLVTTEAGIGLRLDNINNLELSHTIDRYTLLNRLAYGNVFETNIAAYISESIKLSNKININTGIRFDQFFNQYTDHLKSDSNFSANSSILSPKLSVYFNNNKYSQFYINIGKGFHSNDTRVAVQENGRKVLPPAYSTDLGTILKPNRKLLIQAAIWHLWLDQEFVYSGDGAYVEPSGKTQRKGFDFSIRYEPLKSVYIDADINYAHGRFTEEQKGANYIPLAPVWSSTGGITIKKNGGLNGSIRYRWLGNRPGKEDYSLVAKGYFVNDMVLNYSFKKYEIGVSINNIFNVKWKETQFDTESRLKNEASPVEEIHFTPGTKILGKLMLSVNF